MDDCISRSQAIVTMMDLELDQLQGKNGQEIISVLEGLPSAKPEWIPCSERLPDNQNIVLCSIPASGEFCDRIAFCYYTEFGGLGWRKSDWLGSIGRYGKMEPEPIAWMPLPKPYAEKETSKAYCTSMMDWCPYYEKDCRECEHNKKETKNGRP